MFMCPLISVIIPVYERHELLAPVLNSIYAQTYRPLEIVIVDDGSKIPVDIKKLPHQDEIPITLIRQKNAGAPNSRNNGFRKSRGEYVIFWDADTLGAPSALAILAEKLKESPDACYSYSDFYFGRKKMPAKDFDPKLLLTNNYINTTSLIRRDDFLGFDESVRRFQDWDLWLTLLEKNKIGVYAPGYLFRIISTRGTMSRWLPAFMYKSPWKWLPLVRGRVAQYEKAKEVIKSKHGLLLEGSDKHLRSEAPCGPMD